MNKNYVSGRALEYKIAILFRRKGYFVVRSAGSHGAADLVAVKRGKKPLLIQAKKGKGGISIEERNKLFLTAIEVDSVPIVVIKEDRKLAVYTQLTGIAVKHGENQILLRERDL